MAVRKIGGQKKAQQMQKVLNNVDEFKEDRLSREERAEQNRQIQRIGSRVKSIVSVKDQDKPKKLSAFGRINMWIKSNLLHAHTYTGRGKGPAVAAPVVAVGKRGKPRADEARAPIKQQQQPLQVVPLMRCPTPLECVLEKRAAEAANLLKAVSMPGPAPSAPPASDA